ncbi:iron uptake system protein EfeO [Pengzhenrongella frigida]|uniref:PbrT family lead (Pb2+) uptake porter n=1 Tax=Pengzhenrongella frigida TaxID=1259133 RepID=A0A4Q5N1P9_9MICO|nr:iron uptake system protein EfeO [Cellulomonas sp. HLT2-17]RYV52020.1 PbrT family lead (Pb2+) uptake porter [Cellulomonas sp. HLT2-17]
MRARRSLTALAATALLIPLAACTQNDVGAAASGGNGPTTLTVDSSADACAVSATTAPSGTVVFSVTNSGSEVTEFYLLAADGLRIVAEVENVGPGITRDLVLAAQPGTYQTACKPGMTGTGQRAEFTVTDSGIEVGPTGEVAEQLATASTNYVAYVQDQTEQLLVATEAFAAAFLAGDDDAARAAYASTRVHWERIEPVAESFGDLDPRMDLREADVEPGTEWTGWHLLEKDLWAPTTEANGGVAYVPLTAEQRTQFTDQLVADTLDLDGRVHADDFTLTADQIGNGAKSLLDEVATGKVTGEEEIWSHTDLWDFQANVDGARVAFEGLRDVVAAKDAELATTLDERFADVQLLLDAHRAGDGFAMYTDLTSDEVRALANAVDALGEPLSRLTSAVVL